MAVSLYLSVFIRVSPSETAQHMNVLGSLLPVFILIRIGTFSALGVYNIIWRYVSLSDVTRLLKGIALSSLIIVAATYFIDLGRLPRSVFFIDALLVTLGLLGLRMSRRMVFDHLHKKRAQDFGRKTLIIGADNLGRTLAQRLNADQSASYKLVGFLDDDLQKVGRDLGGVRVLGIVDQISDIIREYAIQEVIVAHAQPSGDQLRKLVQATRAFNIRPRVVSRLDDAKKTQVEMFRPIDLQDLLSRPSKEMDLSSIDKLLRGKRVLITGAGGSIGSEIARQVMKFAPSRLLLLDHAEFNLYTIDQELCLDPASNEVVVPLLTDVKDRSSLETVMKTYLPQVVFHAAAYKHVHLVESNPHSAILNNVSGTKNLVDLCVETGVENFVLISTDKAVNPAGVMGATKRLCELLVAHASTLGAGKFCAVRFGNVLGSSGSLIPLLQKQISSGEPITITHKDMARYFMLIPEAVSLVLKSATLAGPGDICILKMGTPIKILDLAKSLITLMGKSDREVPIMFTGIRPGEKLVEELYLCGNEVNTEHPDILLALKGDQRERRQSESFNRIVEEIISLSRAHKKEALFQLFATVEGGRSDVAEVSEGAEVFLMRRSEEKVPTYPN